MKISPVGRPCFPVTQKELDTVWRLRVENDGTPFRMKVTPGFIEIVFEQDMYLVPEPMPRFSIGVMPLSSFNLGCTNMGTCTVPTHTQN